MKLALSFIPQAERDISDAYQWYEERSPGLGGEFLRALDVCFASIERNPLAYPAVHKELRRALVKRFPYAIFYAVHEGRLAVLACFHGKRDPKHLSDRAG